ncbi:MAG: DUF4388 domain-containing protein [Gemmatimonadetes bacterium]|nr:MAG: DUF4388 domain-containing protein [Gemmatimonadota bacterium]
MQLEGPVRRFQLAHVYRELAYERQTGMLIVSDRNRQAGIYFSNGQLVFAKQSSQQDRLGDRLVAKGYITEDQLREAITIQRRSDETRRLGRILIDEQFVGAAIIEQLMQDQIKEVVLEVLDWNSGTYRFMTGMSPPEEDVLLQIAIENLILEGLRRRVQWEDVRTDFVPAETVFGLKPRPNRADITLHLTAEEWNTLTQVNGIRTLDELRKTSTLDADETGRILYILYQTGLIHPVNGTLVEDKLHLSEKVAHLNQLLEAFLTTAKA